MRNTWRIQFTGLPELLMGADAIEERQSVEPLRGGLIMVTSAAAEVTNVN